jgi:hypothetical protein
MAFSQAEITAALLSPSPIHSGDPTEAIVEKFRPAVYQHDKFPPKCKYKGEMNMCHLIVHNMDQKRAAPSSDRGTAVSARVYPLYPPQQALRLTLRVRLQLNSR